MYHFVSLPGLKYEIFSVALHPILRLPSIVTTASQLYPKDAVALMSPTNAEAPLIRGLDLFASGSPLKAARVFRRSIKSGPEHYEAHHGLVRALYDADQLEQSIAAAQEPTALTPNNPPAYTALSISLQHAGRIPEAETAAAKTRILEWKVQVQASPGESA
jgi:Flp pilus assembly protein TadD